jgi:hypothetical protein
MMRSSKVAGTVTPTVAGTAAFLFAYRLYGITCSYAFPPPSCANSNGRLFAPVSDFRPTWLAALMAGLAVAWVTHLALDRRRAPRDRLQFLAALGLAAVVPLVLQWQGAGGHLAAWTALTLPFFVAPFALGTGLARQGPISMREVLAGVTSTAGAGIAATVTVLWATHRLWGTVRTPHLLLWTVALAPGLGIAAMMIHAGAALRSQKTGAASENDEAARAQSEGDWSRPNGLPSESRHTAQRSPGWITSPPAERTRSSAEGRSATPK